MKTRQKPKDPIEEFSKFYNKKLEKLKKALMKSILKHFKK